MDSKFYVSLKAARLLKEKGYNESTEYLHLDDITYKGICLNYLKPELCGGMIVEDNSSYPCPTKAEAIDWLDSKGKIIEVLQDYRGQWFYVIKEVCVSEDNNTYFSTRLEAEDAAIIKACEFL
jgi:hypothetical protein